MTIYYKLIEKELDLTKIDLGVPFTIDYQVAVDPDDFTATLEDITGVVAVREQRETCIVTIITVLNQPLNTVVASPPDKTGYIRTQRFVLMGSGIVYDAKDYETIVCIGGFKFGMGTDYFTLFRIVTHQWLES